MNQILFYLNDYKKKQRKNFIFFLVMLCFSSILIFFFFLFYTNKTFYSNQSLKESNYLSDTISYETLYLNNTPNSDYPIIGRIHIEKININYPIFSYTTDDLLKLGICRFSGPYPNHSGNLCLAGHNYNSNVFFSNLYKLSNNDIITIYDNYNNSVLYKVYNSFEVLKTDTSILNASSNSKELTLITCNNVNKNRLIVKAKEIE